MAETTTNTPAEYVPPDRTVWQNYNDRYELPLSIVSSIFAYAFCCLIFVLVVLVFKGGDDRKPIPISLYDGEDPYGAGSSGHGGVPDPIAMGSNIPVKEAMEKLNLPISLPDLQKQVQDSIRVDAPDASVVVPDATAIVYGALDEELRKKMFGQRKGQGEGPGRGFDKSNGSGPGGTGSDSTLARSMRWVMKFQVTDGRDYVRQLALMKTTVLVPIPPNNKQMMIFEDLTHPKAGVIASDADIDRLSRCMRFSDMSDEAVKEVSRALGINSFTPYCFFAFFPKDLEDDLAKKERTFRNRRTEDIEETKFRVTVRGNSFDIQVVDQKVKR